MNFRDRVQDIIAGQANPAADAFEGYAGLRSSRVSGNTRESGPERAPECGNGDTFLELFKSRSEYQFFRGKKSPVGGPERALSNSETHPGSEPSKPPKALPLIPPEKVRDVVEREVRWFTQRGIPQAEARQRAIDVTQAKVRNSEALAERQANGSRCHVCNEPLTDDRISIAVLTGKPGVVLHLHADCHDEHRRHMTEKVDTVMNAAGYGYEGETT